MLVKRICLNCEQHLDFNLFSNFSKKWQKNLIFHAVVEDIGIRIYFFENQIIFHDIDFRIFIAEYYCD